VAEIRPDSIEGFWSLVKRGMVGKMYEVSRRCLPPCVMAFQLRYNNRENADVLGEAIQAC